VRLYPFSLTFLGNPEAARFSLFMDGQALDIGCAISSRSAGNMLYSQTEESPARERFFRSLGLERHLVRSCVQIHSREVLFADSVSDKSRPKADGLVCGPLSGGQEAGRNLALALTAADCLPVFLYDTGSGAFAFLHSGWKGTGIALKALALMGERWGSRPEATAALLGPCIRSCCYQVEPERARAFEAEFGGKGGEYPLGRVIREWKPEDREGEKRGAAFSLDLQAANARLLANAGVRNITYCEDCTFTDERLGSFRREGAAYTRMAAVMGAFYTP
jgi:YfiH family protein